MKTYTKTIWNICACMLIILLGGCADDDIIRNDCGSTLQETESHLISTFSLPEGKTPIQDTREQIFFQLRSLSDNSIQLMEGKIRKNAGILSCEMFIPNNLVLEDGDYILWLKFDEEGSVYPLSYHLTFRDKMVSMVRDTKYIYEMLNGEGTEENPYLITSTNDFAYLVSQLATYDSNYGYGQFFKQIADIKAPIPNCLYQGNAYKSAPFAGNYDGDSHKILNLTYLGTNGGEQSDAIGLFSILHDGAVIRNLDIEGADIEYPGNCCGLLAGVANGNIRIENITLNGNIKSTKDKVGGLIGYIEGNAQSLAQISIRNVRLGVSFSESGSSYIGALIGWAENASIQVEDISSDGIFKNLRGNNHVAGLIGKLYGQIDARKIKLQHTTLNDFPISGNQNVGGLIGEAFLQAASNFKDITIDMPIKGSSYVGGLIGQIRSEAPTNILIAIENFQLSNPANRSQIQGGSYVGGMIGYSHKTHANAFTIELKGESLFHASITGQSVIGGIFGSLDDTQIQFTPASRLYMDNESLEASSGICGTLAGALSYQEPGKEILLDPEILVINPNIKIKGGNNVGGIIGKLYNGTLTGTYTPEFSTTNVIVSKIPRPIFPGNINSEKPYRENAASIGGIVGYADKSTLRRLFTQPSIYGRSTVGGIIGYASDTQISDCGVKTETFNNGNNSAIMVGGIIGQASCSSHCEFSNLVNYSNISSGSNYIGGIFGSMVAGTSVKINKVVNLGKISATNNVGGIIGKTSGKDIEVYDAANFGVIQGIAGDKECGVGGIAGAAEDAITIYKSVNHGNITINRNAKYYGAGGILGYVKQGGAHVRYCCNRANIDYPKDKEDSHGIGGIVGSIEKANDNDDSYVLDCYNMGEINGQQKATSTLGTDYRGGIVGNLGSHGRCYRAVNGGYVRFGNAGVGYGNKKNLTHIYISPGTGKDFGATSIPLPIREDKNIYQGFDFTGDHDPNRQPVWVLGGTYSSENKMLPYLHSGKCYFQFAKYAP
ncbi:GLUG motif family protein [Parabacteroides distasonis str. 3776 D15 iv]|uniref:GLUG motif family protein n=1 Tax=Parabacteroides distasonis str. 3776 D15 i TaxID=1339342 RepID=A0AB34LBD2_PARDI|nr:hypothetical protein [Parabacteroides distasonis]KDS37328.1 GLUG motif family protein [Parabacteroides distasonis str. 3776 D15 i]KDS73596.1 GLUG motif family protein [Parabacteroides distasonis str. 3776 D15 iv]